ncbi:MAG: SDR family oxidoreductase [Acidobacteriota bacterium]
MRTLVTGGAGFIGSHLVDRLLADGHDVLVLDNLATGQLHNLDHHKSNKKLQFVETDVAIQAEIMPLFNDVDWVFHLAALADIVPSIQKPEEYYHSNVNGTFSVLECARKSEAKRFLYTASSSCYGIPDSYPTPESAEIRPQYPYALTKFLGEQMAMHWGQVYKLPVVSLRLFNVYGPRHRTTGAYGAVFGVFLKQKLAGQPYTVVGDGTQTRDFTYVTDVADAFVSAAESGVVNEVFNVGSGGTYSVNRLVELLKGDVSYIPKRPGEPDCTFADISKIIKMIGWEPHVTFEEGVNRVMEHIELWRDAPLWTPDTIAEATKDWFRYLG